MSCNACVVKDLRFEVKAEGEQNRRMLSSVVDHLERKGVLVEAEADRFVVKEDGMRDFLDFCRDHMDAAGVSFRMDKEDWSPIAAAADILDSQWIDKVIANGLVTCHAQPILTRNVEVFAYEMLARFYQEDGSVIFPGEIFGAARKRGRLYALDRLCRMTAVRFASFIDKKAFINFIPTSIYSPEFCLKSTVQLANRLGVDPSQLVFEVVETDKVEDTDHLKRILAYYREKGFRYALDDMGAGFSTVELLSELQPHYMKLDMKYVHGVSKDPEKQMTAEAFLQQALKLRSVPLAEGIETREDFEWLRNKGYQLFQGYLFVKPAPIAEKDKISVK
ncbi:EAL domain-containing protein [Cytobacillus oceanisediminis]|uniref:EAL domain-containing protein n=1 Tax=Cytobacillus oceanisediminis TaxID=665099 RepID=UPI0023DC4764|nr:EAL domain-containing protein [Cytobacillus oceanisediminis]MDF2036973.1 EAL domain-containing protein [Cytobacillus oceanisediminis]